MPRFPLQGAAIGAALLQHCALVVVVAAVLADARTLRYRGAALKHAPLAIPLREHSADPCVMWLQEHAGQPGAAIAAGGAPPCPCLQTPPPLMSAEQTQAVEVKAAADNAMLKGFTRIEEAALEAAKPVEEELKAFDEKAVEQEAKESLDFAEKNQTNSLKLLLGSEKIRQEKEMADMEADANFRASLSAAHVRETAEQWAQNQAKNFIGLSAGGTLAGIIATADKTAKIRQEATELTKGAIKSAAESLEVAKQAQAAIDNVPKEIVVSAKKKSAKMEVEQKALNVEIERIEGSVKRIAEVATESYGSAMATLTEAKAAELTAREALETSRGNAVKIEKLKDRAQAVATKAKEAEVELKKSQGI